MINLQPMRDLMKWFDKTLSHILEIQRQKGQPVRLTCAKGCFACCDEPLKVTEGEIDLILADMTAEEKEALKPRVLAWAEAAKANRLQNVTGFGKMDMVANGKPINAFGYRALKLTCPLLKDGVCSVYANRPLGCRLHLAVGPKIFCDDVAQRPDQKFMTCPELDDATMHNLMRALTMTGYEEVGISHLGYFLAAKLGLAIKRE